MTTTFPVDNRTILDECDAITGWTATDGPVLFTADPAPVESTGYLAMQASNSIEDAYTSITSDDYSGGGSLTVWASDRAALDTLANVGFGIVIGDGTDRVAFAVGGDVVTAFRHEEGPVKWACYILDPANLPANSAVLAGTLGNLTLTAITQVGVYYNTVVKSVGGADNVFWDIIRWANPGDDVVMQGGTTAGAAGNGAEAAAVDRSTGNQQAYGVIRELASGVYGIQGNLTVGNSASATDQYWEEANVTYAWEARSLSDRNYYRFNFIGRTGQTSSVIFTASTLTCPTDADLRIDANGANLDVVTFDACTFIGVGIGIIGSDDTGDNWTGCSYVDCAALEAKGCDHTDSSFSDGRVCALIEGQDETSYGDTTTQGSFSAGTGYAVSDTIDLSNGARITVDTLSGSAVATFTVTIGEGFPAYPGHTLTQSATSGTGTGFELWPRSANLAEGGSIYYDLNVDPDGELDGISFTKGTADTHAIVFGPNIPATITLRGQTYSGYSASNNVASSTLHFLDTTGTITVNVLNGDTPSYKTEGATISIVSAQPLEVTGVTRGTSCKIIAEQTVGTITKGDVLLSGFADANGEVVTTLGYEGAFNPDGLLVRAQARNQGIFVSAQVEDNGTGFTDETSDLNSSTASDVPVWPATPAVNDAIYFGHTDTFSRLKVVVGTARSGPTSLTTVWEYWNGLAWTSVTVNDPTTNFSAVETARIELTGSTTGWATTTVNAVTGLYWLRCRITAITGAFTTVPALSRANHDGDRYLPFTTVTRFVSTGLVVTAAWNLDTISKFDPND